MFSKLTASDELDLYWCENTNSDEKHWEHHRQRQTVKSFQFSRYWLIMKSKILFPIIICIFTSAIIIIVTDIQIHTVTSTYDF